MSLKRSLSLGEHCQLRRLCRESPKTSPSGASFRAGGSTSADRSSWLGGPVLLKPIATTSETAATMGVPRSPSKGPSCTRMDWRGLHPHRVPRTPTCASSHHCVSLDTGRMLSVLATLCSSPVHSRRKSARIMHLSKFSFRHFSTHFALLEHSLPTLPCLPLCRVAHSMICACLHLSLSLSLFLLLVCLSWRC